MTLLYLLKTLPKFSLKALLASHKIVMNKPYTLKLTQQITLAKKELFYKNLKNQLAKDLVFS